jgi:hypothetical protein
MLFALSDIFSSHYRHYGFAMQRSVHVRCDNTLYLTLAGLTCNCELPAVERIQSNEPRVLHSWTLLCVLRCRALQHGILFFLRKLGCSPILR